jgi:hypothetical protein
VNGAEADVAPGASSPAVADTPNPEMEDPEFPCTPPQAHRSDPDSPSETTSNPGNSTGDEDEPGPAEDETPDGLKPVPASW